jgi:AcrR family transcriptional regulator
MGPKKPAAPGKEARREQIVDTALSVFSRRGYRGATTRELARAAGITEVTLFRYFPTKEELFAAVLDKHSILPVLREEAGSGAKPRDGREMLRHLGARILRILTERRDIIRLMLGEAAANPAVAQMLYRRGPGRILGEMEKLIAGCQEQGILRPMNPRIAARGVLGVFFSYVTMNELFFSREQAGPKALDEAAEVIGDMLWSGLKTDGSTRKRAKGGPRP